MDFSFSEEHEVFRKDLVNFLGEVLPDDWNTLDVESPYSPPNLQFTKEMATTLSEKGWLTMAWPKEYGGQGRSIMEQLIYREEMSYHSVPGSDLGTGAISWVGPTLMIAGTDQQKKEHLPPIAKAERYWCTLYSEPGSGSDLASLQTSAIRDGDDFIVNGTKIWTSSAHIADWG
jgi:alkylation response protein AidB-like acyl-CoA dehydrogenase